MLIGNARVSKVDGSQSLDLQSGVSFLWTPVQLLTASTLHRRTSRLLKKSVEWDRQIDPGVLPCSQYC